MTAEQFALWFQGFAELTPEPPNAAQWTLIRAHAATVFQKETPPLVTELGALRRRNYPLDEVRDILRPRRSVNRDRIIC